MRIIREIIVHQPVIYVTVKTVLYAVLRVAAAAQAGIRLKPAVLWINRVA